MNFDIILNNELINVSLIHKKKLKNIYLRIINNKQLQIRANRYFTINDSKKFIDSKKSWILKHFTKKNSNKIEDNEYFYLGEVFKKYDDFDLIEFYKKKSLEIMPDIVNKNAFLMNVTFISLKFRNNKSRWGSCSFKNAISLNINLMKFPLDVIEYVIIHELAHIKHKNHSQKFWNEVEKYCSNFRVLNAKLKEY